MDKLRELGVDGIDAGLHLHRRPASKTYIDTLHRAGLSCNVWVVDDPAAAAHLIELGVDSITTNRPSALKQELASGAY